MPLFRQATGIYSVSPVVVLPSAVRIIIQQHLKTVVGIFKASGIVVINTGRPQVIYLRRIWRSRSANGGGPAVSTNLRRHDNAANSRRMCRGRGTWQNVVPRVVCAAGREVDVTRYFRCKYKRRSVLPAPRVTFIARNARWLRRLNDHICFCTHQQHNFLPAVPYSCRGEAHQTDTTALINFLHWLFRQGG